MKEIVVKIKSNPGESTHDDNGARGYINIANVPLKDIGITATTLQTRRLRTRVKENPRALLAEMTKQSDLAPLEPRVIAPINGLVGFRSDTGNFTFKLFVADASPRPDRTEVLGQTEAACQLNLHQVDLLVSSRRSQRLCKFPR
ncbi:hypothetical protein NZK35_17810 [Stieleria sp. ICT_E10.1]|uniref:hypothetical protein n=1 Tax=Stieleria sedimenti TaxID=2976331 RepID=UPI0021807479|nr:hypothetical protein [Stieleria sedimenti]MCS7468512.1 hypothetical protein [Stieleria sedimenti]